MKKLKYAIPLVVVSILIAGCTEPKPERENITNYKCSSKQADLVKKIFEPCNESDFVSSFCYTYAVITACEYVGGK